ncbi:MAG: hypothetical protein LBK61_07925 [Spirochaetaceae bacterium]|jgi:hypothetical protein|nr:hypothetical protein [Spirochaetaceae bacterium]
MEELIVVESVIGIFLLAHIVRPYIGAFREATGFVFFPVIALFCCVAMIPAYGVRPECFPLFLFTAIYTILYFPSVTAFFSRLKNYSDYDSRLPLSFLAVVLLAASLVAAFRFSPQDEQPFDSMKKTQFTVNDSSREVDLFVSYYEGNGNDLVLITPPVTMPLSLIEDICFALKETGYKVLAFSRPYFDNFAVGENGETIELPVTRKIKRYTQAINGIKNRAAIPLQRNDAAEREADIRFLLSALKSNPQLREIAPHYENIFLLGYGAGGAAAVGLSGDRGFLRANPEIKAVAAIESVVLCDFSVPEYEPDKNILRNIKNMFGRFFKKPALRLENITHPEIPVLFVAGDGSQAKNSYDRYMAVVQTMIESETPFLFASVNGIHAIDFSAFFRKYPVLPLFIKAKKEGVWSRENAVENTAAYIAAFFSFTKDSPSVNALVTHLANRVPPGAVFMETSRSK